jgi:hypothetical protein
MTEVCTVRKPELESTHAAQPLVAADLLSETRVRLSSQPLGSQVKRRENVP